MKISVKELKTLRDWRAATGLDNERFNALLFEFKISYIERFNLPLQERLVDSGIDYCINNEEELLFFTLFSLKSGLGYDNLGLVTGMGASNAYKNQKTGVQLLKSTLDRLGFSPVREFPEPTDLKQYFSEKGIENILIDVAEHIKQRPSDNDIQKDYYSGKKKLIR